MVSCEGLIILILKAINVARPCHHHWREGSFQPKVVSGHLHEVSCDTEELLGRGDHVDLLGQELSQFFLGESIWVYGKQDMDSCGLLLGVSWS